MNGILKRLGKVCLGLGIFLLPTLGFGVGLGKTPGEAPGKRGGKPSFKVEAENRIQKGQGFQSDEKSVENSIERRKSSVQESRVEYKGNR